MYVKFERKHPLKKVLEPWGYLLELVSNIQCSHWHSCHGNFQRVETQHRNTHDASGVPSGYTLREDGSDSSTNTILTLSAEIWLKLDLELLLKIKKALTDVRNELKGGGNLWQFKHSRVRKPTIHLSGKEIREEMSQSDVPSDSKARVRSSVLMAKIFLSFKETSWEIAVWSTLLVFTQKQVRRLTFK